MIDNIDHHELCVVIVLLY